MTRVQRPPDDLIRFVLSPDGLITPDLVCTLPGRGVWVSATRDMVARAVKTRAFERSLKQPVGLPDDLPGLVERLLVKRLIGALAIANKAGLVVSGFSKVDAALSRGRIAALLHAGDAAEDGAAKLDRKFRAIKAAAGGQARILRCLSSAELSLAIGRTNVVHAGLSSGGASDNFLSEAGRLLRYRSEFDASMGAEAPHVAKVEHG